MIIMFFCALLTYFGAFIILFLPPAPPSLWLLHDCYLLLLKVQQIFSRGGKLQVPCTFLNDSRQVKRVLTLKKQTKTTSQPPTTSPQQYSCHFALSFYIALPQLTLKLHCSSVIYTERWWCVRCVKQSRSVQNGHTWSLQNHHLSLLLLHGVQYLATCSVLQQYLFLCVSRVPFSEGNCCKKHIFRENGVFSA